MAVIGAGTTDARGALARLLEGMVAQNPTAAELQRVITVLQGAPEARIAQAVLDATSPAALPTVIADTAPEGASSPSGVSAGANMPTSAIPSGAVTPGGVPIAVGAATPVSVVVHGAVDSGVVVPETDGVVPNVPVGGGQVGETAVASRRLAVATDPNASTVSGAPTAAAVTAGAVSVALASSIASGGQSAWVAAGPDARSFLGALLALFGGTTRPGSTPLATGAGATLPQPPDPPTAGTPPSQLPERLATPAAMLARVIHDRLEYQQLGNAATLARGGWENGVQSGTSPSGTPTPGSSTLGTRPEANAPAFPPSVLVPPPGDALNFSVPLAFAGQMATLELTVWRDGGRRQDAQEESTPGLHARMRLDLSQLGRVGADIRIAGQNLRCRLTADRAETTALLQENGEALLGRLRDVGFTVEGLDYRPFASSGSGSTQGEGPSVVRRVDMGL
jgi:hypothetical protein